jgi:hypothetical protein
MFAAKSRRPKNSKESKAIKTSLLNFMSWGIMKIDKTMRFELLKMTLYHYPEMLLKQSVISALLGLLKTV